MLMYEVEIVETTVRRAKVRLSANNWDEACDRGRREFANGGVKPDEEVNLSIEAECLGKAE